MPHHYQKLTFACRRISRNLCKTPEQYEAAIDEIIKEAQAAKAELNPKAAPKPKKEKPEKTEKKPVVTEEMGS